MINFPQATNYQTYINSILESNNKNIQNTITQLNNKIKEGIQRDSAFYDSDEYRDLVNQVVDATNQIDQNTISIQNNLKAMKEIIYSIWDRYDTLFSHERNSISNFASLIQTNYTDITDDETGQLTTQGKELIALYTIQYQIDETNIKDIKARISQLKADLAKDPHNKDIQDELLKQEENLQSAYSQLQQDSQNLKSIEETRLKKELSLLQEIVNTRKEELDAEKDLYDYQKNVENQTKNIAKLRKQLMAYSNDTSEENRSRVQKLQVQLKQAEEDLKETEWERQISEEQRMLDDLYSNFEQLIDDILAQPLNVIAGNIMQSVSSTESQKSILANLVQESQILNASLPRNLETYLGSGSTVATILTGNGLKLNDEYTSGLLSNWSNTLSTNSSFTSIVTAAGTINTNIANIASYLNQFYTAYTGHQFYTAYTGQKAAEAAAAAKSTSSSSSTASNSTSSSKPTGYTGVKMISLPSTPSNVEIKSISSGSTGSSTVASNVTYINSLSSTYARNATNAVKNLKLNSLVKNKKASDVKSALKEVLNKNKITKTSTNAPSSTNSNLAKYLWSKSYNTSQNTMRSLWNSVATLYGYKKVSNSDNLTGTQKNQLLKILINNGFRTGGTIGSIIKRTGEDGFILAQSGEEVLSLEKIKGMINVLDGFEPLANALANADNYSTTNNTFGTNMGDVTFTINLPNVSNYDEFKTGLQNDKTFQKWTQEITLGQSLGHNSYKSKKYV